ncbi:hypothetical protein KR032_012047 [Drosophila birchii]|nr:hypothetical protein KR032_012047 [Drosophila birchii]
MVSASLTLNYIFATSFYVQYTLRRAQKLGVRGWCQNTKTNTVKGEIEALFNAFEEMRLWLKYTGSPTSRIDKVIFSDTVEREQFTYENFTILMES